MFWSSCVWADWWDMSQGYIQLMEVQPGGDSVSAGHPTPLLLSAHWQRRRSGPSRAPAPTLRVWLAANANTHSVRSCTRMCRCASLFKSCYSGTISVLGVPSSPQTGSFDFFSASLLQMTALSCWNISTASTFLLKSHLKFKNSAYRKWY